MRLKFLVAWKTLENLTFGRTAFDRAFGGSIRIPVGSGPFPPAYLQDPEAAAEHPDPALQKAATALHVGPFHWKEREHSAMPPDGLDSIAVTRRFISLESWVPVRRSWPRASKT